MRRPVVPYGYVDQEIVHARVQSALRQPSQRKRQAALIAIIETLLERIAENEAVIEAGSQPVPNAAPQRLEP